MYTKIYDEDDNFYLDCWGYSKSKLFDFFMWLLNIIFLGLPFILFKIKPHWKLIFYRGCDFESASVILIKNKYDYEVCNITRKKLESQSSIAPFFKLNKGDTDNLFIIYFEYHFSQYYWNSLAEKFEKSNGIDKSLTCYQLLHSYKNGLSPNERDQRFNLFGPNLIHIEVKSYFKLFIEEVMSPFYIFQVFSVILWLCDEYYYYAACIILITTMSIAISLYEMKKQNISIRDMVSKGGDTNSNIIVNQYNHGSLLKEQLVAKPQIMNNSRLVPGDLMSLNIKRGYIMPCDAVLVAGTCIVNESVLTGESVPIIKTAISNQGCDTEIFDSNVHKKHVLFAGTEILSARPPASSNNVSDINEENTNHDEEPTRAISPDLITDLENQNASTGYVDQLASLHQSSTALAIVIKTGFSTTKGQLVRSILHPNPIGFEFYKDSLRFVAVLAFLAGFGMVYSVYVLWLRKASIATIIIRTLDVITIVVPPALPAAMTVGTAYAQRRLKRAKPSDGGPIFCISPPRINISGRIDLACFDKTGTLTEEGLDYWGVVPLQKMANKLGQLVKNVGIWASLTNISNDGGFGESLNIDDQDRKLLLYCMASCHSLTLVDGEVCGDPLELKMFQATDWILEEPNPLLSPDSSLLPTIVKPKLQSSTLNFVEEDPNTILNLIEIGLIKHFAFSSTLQCMSVIVKMLGHRNFDVFTKGAPEKILSLCNHESVPPDYLQSLRMYTEKGFRVIALAHRSLNKKITWHHIHRMKRNEFETDLNFLGFLILKNSLKPCTKGVIEELHCADIRTIMITGDNMLTALSVAHECSMIPDHKNNMIVCLEIVGKVTNNEPNSIPIEKFDITYEVLEKIDKERMLSFSNNENSHQNSDIIIAPLNEQVSIDIFEDNIEEINKNRHSKVNLLSSEEQGGDNNTFDAQRVIKPLLQLKKLTAYDNPIYFVLTGANYQLMESHFPQFLDKILPQSKIFARMSPDNKTALIERLKNNGYIVSMCGDGANDCGALKAADVGISLSDAEASIAAPFTAKTLSITCVPTIIREGRCSLVTSFGIFKFMALYSLIQFTSVLILYTYGHNLSDVQFLYIDLGIITTLAIFMGKTGPFPKLICEKPPSCLMTQANLIGIFCQISLQIIFQVMGLFFVMRQPWFKDHVIPMESKSEIATWHTTSIFWISCFQYLIMVIVYSYGKPFRLPLYTNVNLLLNLVLVSIFNLILIFGPFRRLHSFFQFPIDEKYHLKFRVMLCAIICLNILASIIFEKILMRCAFLRPSLNDSIFSAKRSQKLNKRKDEMESIENGNVSTFSFPDSHITQDWIVKNLLPKHGHS